jgi:hypothetical protein
MMNRSTNSVSIILLENKKKINMEPGHLLISEKYPKPFVRKKSDGNPYANLNIDIPWEELPPL